MHEPTQPSVDTIAHVRGLVDDASGRWQRGAPATGILGPLLFQLRSALDDELRTSRSQLDADTGPHPDDRGEWARGRHVVETGQPPAELGKSLPNRIDVRYWRELARECERELRRLRYDLAEACERTEAERRRPELDSVLLDHLLATLTTLATS